MLKTKLKSSKGMTLTELLCVIVIMLLITSVMVTGINLAVKVLNKGVSNSEAQILCSSLIKSIEDDLRYAEDVKYSGTSLISYTSKSFGGKNMIMMQDSQTGQIIVKNLSDGTSQRVLSPKAYTNGERAQVQITVVETSGNIPGHFHVVLTITDESGSKELIEKTFDVEPLANTIS